jgi:hypothetical protein
MILADMCRKKIDAMNERESTRTMNGSLNRQWLKRGGEERGWQVTHTLNPGESSV